MDKKLILAKAGAGKTYHICHCLDINKRNLILAFTNQNISNILRELEDSNNGVVPELTSVSTFHSFVYRTFIRPFEKIIAANFGKDDFMSNGVEVENEPEPMTIKIGNISKPNYRYIKKDNIGHFYTDNQTRIYVSRMSELPLCIDTKTTSIVRLGIEYLSRFYDHIYIDEVQDFRENDWKLLVKIIEGVKNITLVGDFYQHSSSGSNNSGQPFKSNNTYDLYKKYLTKLKVAIDEDTLSKSRRCPQEVCDFVSKKLHISLEKHMENKNEGSVKIVSDCFEAKKLYLDESIMKLVIKDSKKQIFKPVINWGYSKGDTYSSVAVILTEEISKTFQDKDFFIPEGATKNKLYVALTRTKGDLYVIKYDTYKMALSL